MAKKPTYEELEQRVKELEKAEFERKRTVDVLSARMATSKSPTCGHPKIPHL